MPLVTSRSAPPPLARAAASTAACRSPPHASWPQALGTDQSWLQGHTANLLVDLPQLPAADEYCAATAGRCHENDQLQLQLKTTQMQLNVFSSAFKG